MCLHELVTRYTYIWCHIFTNTGYSSGIHKILNKSAWDWVSCELCKSLIFLVLLIVHMSLMIKLYLPKMTSLRSDKFLWCLFDFDSPFMILKWTHWLKNCLSKRFNISTFNLENSCQKFLNFNPSLSLPNTVHVQYCGSIFQKNCSTNLWSKLSILKNICDWNFSSKAHS